MNIDDCIKTLQESKDGKTHECRRFGRENLWGERISEEFNFVGYEYRLAPDVVYKIDCGSEIIYDTHCPAHETTATYTKGYWVEGNPA